MLPENISEQNSFIRLIAGVTCVGIGTAKVARNPNCKIGASLIILGAMKVAEGIYQYCPIVALKEHEY